MFAIWVTILLATGAVVVGSAIAAGRRLPRRIDSASSHPIPWPASIALLIVPLAVLVISSDIREARGPYWLGSNCDPDYVYLLNALRLVHGLEPAHRDHPGTPLQMLGAVVLEVTNGFPAAAELTSRVIANPEPNLDAIRWCITLTYALVLALTGVLAYRKADSLVQALCLQATPLLSVTALFEIPRVRTESLALVLSALLALAVFHQLHERNTSRLRAYVAIDACLIGLSIATKVTALPLAFVPLILLPTTRSRLTFALGACAAFFVAILPMISYLPGLAGWFWSVASHQGDYGRGVDGFASLDTLAGLTRVLAQREPAFVLIVASSAVVALVSFVRRPAGERHGRETGNTAMDSLQARRALLAILVAETAGWLLAAKGHRAHYLIPVLGLAGLNLALLVERSRRIENWRPLLVTLGLAVALFLLANQAREVVRGRANLIEQRDFQLAVQQRMVTRYKAWTKVYAYMSSSPVHALYFADVFSAGFFFPWLRHAYPDPKFVQFDTWNWVFRSSEGTIGMKKLLRRYRRLVFCGEVALPTEVQGPLVPVLAGSYVGIYEWKAERSGRGQAAPE